MSKHTIEDYAWGALFALITIAGISYQLYHGWISLEFNGLMICVIAALNLVRGWRMMKQGRYPKELE